MKLLSLLTYALIPVAGLTDTASTDKSPVCWSLKYALDVNWKISISPVPKDDIGPLCHELWKGLKRHWLCTVFRPNDCGAWRNDSTPGGEPLDGVRWHFHTTALCNPGMVESAYWEATHNKYGVIQC
ncbi:hypothetical protein DHEL01_v208982 [Diaporthe helianthi]|uniref:Uncharacterized protein n=1 Tax=Diaporthe helianthi TaxID=158607 RepID=A0A2P5HQT0_DIAHE|nr:hypothetical protein DHEL01_v208982 [Diaporthe helianthi]